MHLISPLAAGIRGAEGGTVTVRRRGTSTVATVYSTFESASGSAGSALSLDTNGARVMYVNQLVDVEVYSSTGTLIREFTDGVASPNVEYRGQSFTGTNYDSGASGAGTNYPTTVQAVLGKWKDSAGTTDFNVLVNGSSTTLVNAVAGNTVFNVKSPAYGAEGNGTTSDSAAFAAARAAAVAAGGGTVYLPPGTYRLTSALSLPGDVNLVGAGRGVSTILFDGVAIGVNCSGAAGTANVISDIGFESVNADVQAIYGDLAGHLHVERCMFSDDRTTVGVYAIGGGTLYVGACEFALTVSAGNTGVEIDALGAASAIIEGNVFKTVGGADAKGVYVADVAADVAICGNTFIDDTLSTSYGIVVAGTTPVVNECGNTFSGSHTARLSLTGNAANQRYGARKDRVSSGTNDAATVTLDTDNYDTFIVTRSTAGAQTIEWDRTTTPDGAPFTLIHQNSSGGAGGTMTWGTGFVTSSTTFTVANGLYDVFHFRVSGGVAYQIGGNEAS